jgi:hypothetical protein
VWSIEPNDADGGINSGEKIAAARNHLSLAKKFSTRWRSLVEMPVAGRRCVCAGPIAHFVTQTGDDLLSAAIDDHRRAEAKTVE